MLQTINKVVYLSLPGTIRFSGRTWNKNHSSTFEYMTGRVGPSIIEGLPADWGHWPSVVSMLSQRRRRWPNIEAKLGQRPC